MLTLLENEELLLTLIEPEVMSDVEVEGEDRKD